MRSDRLQHSKLHGRYTCPVNFRQVRGKYTVRGIPVIKSSAPARYNHASTLYRGCVQLFAMRWMRILQLANALDFAKIYYGDPLGIDSTFVAIPLPLNFNLLSNL